ncbi:MAG: hypothetical protein V8R79_04175 [Candidatus Gastranaerophilaceae bacterium]
MTMLGYMTNIVKNDIICDDSNVFRTFPTLINTFMLGFFNKSEIKIIDYWNLVLIERRCSNESKREIKKYRSKF